jgi:CRISPR system Cascade subunit CasB
MIANPRAAVIWWRDLQPDPDRKRPGNRAASARLRRCSTVSEALLDPATMALFGQCRATDPHDLPAIGLAAAVLAHVRKDRPEMSVARQIGPDLPDKPETALVKPLRFRRLMEASSPDERLIAMRRMVALAGGALNVADLAEALLFWSEQRQQRWVYDYWNAGQIAARKAEETTA